MSFAKESGKKIIDPGKYMWLFFFCFANLMKEKPHSTILILPTVLHIIVNIKQTSDQNKGKYKLGDY